MEKQIYSYDEAYEESLRYFQGDELAARVWVNKYAVKDSFGNIYEKSPEDMHWRIANEVARVESKYPNALTAKELYDLLDHFKYIVPQGSPMTGIGNDYQVASLSNCFVIGVDGAADSYGAIIKIDEEQVQLMKRRGGVGHDLSHIRPKGSPVKNSALTSTGLVPFMERYSNSTREVAQDGRRGALMLSVSIKHPDSEAFIDAKMTEGKVTGANVSVKLDDAFMQAAVDEKPYVQQYPIDSAQPTPRKSTLLPCGRKSFTMHGNRQNRAFCSGIRLSVNLCLIVMQTWGIERYLPTHAEKFLYVLTILAAYWLSIYILMW